MKKYRGVFLKNEREIGLLREANRMVAMILDELGRQVRPGLPTMHFEEIVQNMCREFKVKPAFQGMYGFPYGLCCSVNEVIVHGFPSEDVILKEGEDMTEEEIKAYYKENVAFFKIPKYVWIMDEFPMTASGKIQKFVLRDMAVEKYSLQSDDSIETA